MKFNLLQRLHLASPFTEIVSPSISHHKKSQSSPIMSSPSTVLVTGSNKGIGKALLALYLARPSTTAIALIRDPDHSTSQSLPSLPMGKGSKLIVLQYDASIPESAKSAVSTLESSHNITHLDIVVANSGILGRHGPSTTATQQDFLDPFITNTLGAIFLFSATQPLLEKSSNPKFFTVSSSMGSNGQLEAYAPMPMMPYSISKAAVNFAMRKLHFEFPQIVVIPLQPGWVQTDMGGKAAEVAGVKEGAPVTIEQSVTGLAKLIDSATRETSGRFWAYDGKEIPW
jgi:norsolorinic acid ketoreductase